jgi:putative integral membrane protein (TIGR02587 family)
MTQTILDALVAYAVGTCVALTVLVGIAVLRLSETTIEEGFGKVVLQAIPAGFGAVLASSQLGIPDRASENENPSDDSSKVNSHNNLGCYLRELFIMFAGAIFLAFNVAPTEEMLVVALKLTAWHAIALQIMSLIVMHAFVFVVQFRGHKKVPETSSQLSVLSRFTIPGYAIAMLVSLFCLWIFGRTDDTAFDEILMSTTVLAMPASVGAAAARLIL